MKEEWELETRRRQGSDAGTSPKTEQGRYPELQKGSTQDQGKTRSWQPRTDNRTREQASGHRDEGLATSKHEDSTQGREMHAIRIIEQEKVRVTALESQRKKKHQEKPEEKHVRMETHSTHTSMDDNFLCSWFSEEVWTKSRPNFNSRERVCVGTQTEEGWKERSNTKSNKNKHGHKQKLKQ